MKETPNMITSKDLLYIEDMMNWNFILLKNLSLMYECDFDEEVCELIKKVRKMHTKHYKDLLNILE